MIEAVLSLCLALLILGIATILGKKSMEYFHLEMEDEEKLLFSTVIGTGLFSILLFFMGIFHLYYKSTFFILFIVSVIPFWKDALWIVQTLYTLIKRMLFAKKSLVIQCCKIILVLTIIGNFAIAFTPEIQWDSLVYHLTVPKFYAEEHTLIEIPWDYHAYLPKQIDILFVIGELFELEQTSRLISYFFNLFLILGIYLFCKKNFGEDVGIIASTLLYTIPIMLIYQPTTYNDIAMTLFLFYACIAFLKIEEQKKWIFVTGFLLGAAAATKILAFGMIGFFCIALFCKDRKNTYREATILILITLAVLTPWLSLSYLQTGNPVYPFFYSVFGGEHWTPELEEFWMNLREDYGSGRTLLGFVRTPWDLTMHSMKFGPVYGYTPLFFIFLPLFLFLKRRKSEEESFFMWFIFFYFLLWFFLAADGRYIFPLLPGATILVTIITMNLWKERNKILSSIIPCVLLVVLLSNIIFFGIIHRNILPLFLGTIDEDQYKQIYLQNYDLVQWVNKNLDEDAKIFVANDDRTYFLEKEYLGGYPIIQGYIDYVKIDSAEALYSRLKKEQITHVMITHHETTEGIILTPFAYKYNEKIILLWTGLVEQYGKLVQEKNNVFLYELV